MPGTIQVSVVDFMGIQSSLPKSQMCIKVSLGKKEYITRDKGDLFFPLTTLRNDLVVTLQDAEGNEISHTDVQTKLVIEKGFWDDIFPLEGGGYVHMKLLFILNDEDRNRIRKMREAALKKKHDKLLNTSEREQKYAPVIAQLHPEVSDSRTIQEPKSSQDDLVTKSLNFKNLKSDSKITDESRFDQKETTPNDTDTSQETSLSAPASIEGEDLLEKKKLLLKAGDDPVRDVSPEQASSKLKFSESAIAANNNLAPPKPEEYGARDNDKRNQPEEAQVGKEVSEEKSEVPMRDACTEEASSSLAFSESAIDPPKSEADKACESDRLNQVEEAQVSHRDLQEKKVFFTDKVPMKKVFSEGALSSLGRTRLAIATSDKLDPPTPRSEGLKRTPSNVRKMISAFEGSRTQDKQPSVRPPLTKSLSNRVGVEAPFVSMSGQPISGRIVNPFLVGKSQETPVNIRARGEQIGSIRGLGWAKSSKDTGQPNKLGAQIQSTGTNPSLKNSLQVLDKEVDEKEEKRSSETLVAMPTVEQPTVSGRKPNEEVALHQAYNLSTNKLDSQENIPQKDFKNSHILQVSNDKLQSVSNSEGYENCLESSGAWIFPDEGKKLCITTGDKRVIDLMGGWQAEANTYQHGNAFFCESEKVEENSMQSGSNVNVDEGEKTSHGPRKSKLESYVDDNTSDGLVGQAVKVAIMTAFGLLVLFTRQRR